MCAQMSSALAGIAAGISFRKLSAFAQYSVHLRQGSSCGNRVRRGGAEDVSFFFFRSRAVNPQSRSLISPAKRLSSSS